VTELAKSSPHAAATTPVRPSLDRNVERGLVHVHSSSIHSCPRPRPRHSSRANYRRSLAQICSSWLLIRSWTTNSRFANAHTHPPSFAVARDTTFFTPYISAHRTCPFAEAHGHSWVVASGRACLRALLPRFAILRRLNCTPLTGGTPPWMHSRRRSQCLCASLGSTVTLLPAVRTLSPSSRLRSSYATSSSAAVHVTVRRRGSQNTRCAGQRLRSSIWRCRYMARDRAAPRLALGSVHAQAHLARAHGSSVPHPVLADPHQ
jgi:hypothetical protein